MPQATMEAPVRGRERRLTTDELTPPQKTGAGVLGRFLAERMNHLDLSQAEAARMANVSEAAMSMWLNGRKNPEAGSILALATMLAAAEGLPNDERRINELLNRMMRLAGYLPRTAKLEGDRVPEDVLALPSFSAIVTALEDILRVGNAEEAEAAAGNTARILSQYRAMRDMLLKRGPFAEASAEAADGSATGSVPR